MICCRRRKRNSILRIIQKPATSITMENVMDIGREFGSENRSA
jgi:hypothetical protein